MDPIPTATIQEHSWRAFSPGTDAAEARAVFVLRERRQPEVIGCDQWGKVLAGPVEEQVR